MADAISNIHNIYFDILDSEEITNRQALLLTNYFNDVIMTHQRIRQLAITFYRLEPSMIVENKTPVSEIQLFFKNLIGERQVPQNELDNSIGGGQNLKEKVEILNELNSLWLNSLQNNIEGMDIQSDIISFDFRKYQEHYGNRSVTKNYWISLIIDINYKTISFLSGHEMSNIQEILQNG